MKQLAALLKERAIPRVILITGDDYLGREKAKEKIKEALHALLGEIAEERFDSSREPFEVYIERAITPSLFQTVRLFHIRHAQTLSDSEVQRLETILSVEIPDVFMLIEYEQKEGKKKDFAAAIHISKREKKNPGHFALLAFERPPDYKMVQWLMEQVPALFGRSIAKGGAETLIDYAGYELDRLYSELQKLDIHLPEKAPIDKETVKHITGATRKMSAFDLARALAQKDFGRACTILTSLFSDTFYAPPVIAALYHHFWKVLKIRAYAATHKEQANAFFKTAYQEQMKIAHAIGVATGILQASDPEKKAYPVMILSGLMDQARTFRYQEVKQILLWLRDFDVGVKTGRVKPTQQNFEQLCYTIVRVAELVAKDNAL